MTRPSVSVCVSSAGWASLASPARVPLRFYIRVLQEEVDDLYEVPSMVSWDDVAYASKPIDVPKDEGALVRASCTCYKVFRPSRSFVFCE